MLGSRIKEDNIHQIAKTNDQLPKKSEAGTVNKIKRNDS
jgi:hypothetical protein